MILRMIVDRGKLLPRQILFSCFQFLAIASLGPYSSVLAFRRHGTTAKRSVPIPAAQQGASWRVAGTGWISRTIMDSVNIRRINCAQSDGAAKLTALRAQLGLQADVVSPRGRKLTEA